MTTDSYGWKSGSPACSVPYVTPVVTKLLRQHDASRIIDLGCGNGAMTARLAEEGFDIVGCDIDAEGIEIAKKTHPSIEFHCTEFSQLRQLVNGSFDAAISSEVIEHMFDPAQLLRSAATLLNREGKLIVTTPHYGWWKQVSVVATGRWDSHHQTSRVGGHIKLFSPGSLKKLLEEEGYEFLHQSGAGRFPPLYKSLVVVAQLSGTA